MAPTSYDNLGYWSPNTASVDWCEANYRHSYYVAEFFNTFSSICMCLMGEIGVYLCPVKDLRFMLAFRTITVVGVGSALFHGTLKHEAQLLDELPMIYAATVLFFCCVESRRGPQGRWLPIALAVHSAFTSVLVSTTHGNLQFYVFQGSFIVLQLSIIYYMRLFYIEAKNSKPEVIWLFKRGVGIYLTAVVTWLSDLHFCERLNGHGPKSFVRWNPQLHAWWHVLSSIGVYFVCLLVLYQCQHVKGNRPAVYLWKGIIPAIAIKPVDLKAA